MRTESVMTGPKTFGGNVTASRTPAELVAVLLTALGVRAIYAVVCYLIDGNAGLMAPDSTGYVPNAEEFVALLRADQLSGWDYLGLEIDRMPIPAWLMALVHAVFGEQHVLAYVLLQGGLDSLTCLVTALIAQRLHPSLFWPAALAASFNPTMVVVAGLYLTDTIFVLFCALMFLAVQRWATTATWRSALMIGACLGLATLCRTFTFAFIPVMAIALVVAGLIARRSLVRTVLQAVVVGLVSLAFASPILIRNHVLYDAIALTPQSGIHMLAWQVSLVREVKDGTPFSESAAELQARFHATHPDLDAEDRFAVSNAMMAMAMAELGELGPAAIAQAWAIGAAINLGSPAALINPIVTTMPRTGFYDTPGASKLDKVHAFLFENENTAYAWILGGGILGLLMLRLIQLRGLWVWLSAPPPARLYLSFAVLWVVFVLGVSGPVASPKYRLPIEPFLVVALAFGIRSRGAIRSRAEATNPDARSHAG